MLLAVDVHYEDRATTVAGVGFATWAASETAVELVLRDETAPEPYEPGMFYKRELPHLVRVVEAVRRHHAVEAVVIDAHVWLDDDKPGLGAYLYEAFERAFSVIGVAKTSYRDGVAIRIERGQSKSPLFVSAAGIKPDHAAEIVGSMHGPHRLPTLLKRVDQLARRLEPPDPRKALA